MCDTREALKLSNQHIDLMDFLITLKCLKTYRALNQPVYARLRSCPLKLIQIGNMRVIFKKLNKWTIGLSKWTLNFPFESRFDR